MVRTTYRAFIDESGIRSHSLKSSDHFVMSAVMLPESQGGRAREVLAGLRRDFGKPPGAELAFKDLSHPKRVHAATVIGQQPYLAVTNVIVCKRLFADPERDEDTAYLYTLRYTLERISWFVDDKRGKAYVTFAHIIRFRKEKLDAYVARLQTMDTQIRWDALYLPVRMEAMGSNEYLQLADTTASAAGQAFHPNEYGDVEKTYLIRLRKRLYRHPSGPITSYGMKMHPTKAVTDPRYGWVGKL